MRILSWNVNGIRAVYKKNFQNWFEQQQAAIFCVQETKAHQDQLPRQLVNQPSYSSYFAQAERKGYSGVGIWTREKPQQVNYELGIPRFDLEGRLIQLKFSQFILFNVYFPNGKASKERLAYKMDYYETFLKKLDDLRSEGKKIVICGDFNTAHQEIDLARPKENEKVSGFLPQERAWIDQLIEHGFIDTFRYFNADGGHYSWWDYKRKARQRNVGWRIDYFFISENLSDRLTSAFIQSDVMGSDHCPIGIDLNF